MRATVPAIMPGSIRLFVAASLEEGRDIPAASGQAHYLGSVMRRAVGDEIALFNGLDGEWRARISALRKDQARFQVLRRLRPQQAGPECWLLFAPLKRDATDLLVQKATELGASVLQPVLTERTVAGRVNADRLAHIATEAAEQCERLSVPVLRPPCRLPDALAAWPAGRGHLAAAIERAEAPGLDALGATAIGGLLVGPEGGFTETELDLLRRRSFVQPVSLGPLVLRAETAAIAGLALLNARPRPTD